MAIPYLLIGKIGEAGTYLRKSATHFAELNVKLVHARAKAVDTAARTVTLSLTPEQSEKLILLENHPDCRLRLALRGANDDSSAASTVLEFDPVSSMQAIIQP